jgi:hypothetical protein
LEALLSKTAITWIWLSAAFLASCASIETAEKRDEALDAPVNCATARGDLRVLESEKAHVAAQTAIGVDAVWPSSIAYGGGPAGGVTFEGGNLETLAAEHTDAQTEISLYQQDVNKRIAVIKSKCGL